VRGRVKGGGQLKGAVVWRRSGCRLPAAGSRLLAMDVGGGAGDEIIRVWLQIVKRKGFARTRTWIESSPRRVESAASLSMTCPAATGGIARSNSNADLVGDAENAGDGSSEAGEG
jgi:hypothetical protein